jgi:hypothetical protein
VDYFGGGFIIYGINIANNFTLLYSVILNVCIVFLIIVIVIVQAIAISWVYGKYYRSGAN